MTSNNGHDHSNSTRTVTDHKAVRKTIAPKEEKKHSSNSTGLYFVLFLVLLGAIIAFVLFRRGHAEDELKSSTQKMSTPTVLVVHAEKGNAEQHLVLPGTVNAFMESSVYAQVSGYIKRWLVDIGGQVKAGQLLAEIDTPVTDQQLKQAEQSVAQAQANLDLAQVTADRYNNLFKTKAVSQQDVDNQNAGVKVQQANLDAAKAFQSGIEKTEAFKQVTAPFDGVITARHVDVGDFVSATGQTATTNSNGSGPAQTGTPNQSLFRIAQTKTLRIYVNVPEHSADAIKPGITATLDFASAPGQKITGKVVRTANAIDPASLTLLTEVDVDNADGKLLPGGYAQVHFDIITDHPPVVIPANTLIFRAQGAQVGVVDDQNTVHLKNVKIGRDLGTKLEIVDGLDGNDALILNPSDSLADGQKVQVNTEAQPKAP